jgi:uracil-DNA glycosylase
MSTSSPINPNLQDSWKQALADEFQQPYFCDLKAFLLQERQAGRVFFPPGPLIFNALNSTPFAQVKVVVLGQDPYHNPGQAHGLSFSVPRGVAVPRSLANIFKELQTDLGLPVATHGNLEKWTEQGVLLLNSTLTVRAHQANSHQGQGWERFTDAIIRALNDHREGIVFVLWGRSAKEKGKLIDRGRHHVLTAAHPSPLSASNGFFGCGHFSSINQRLVEGGHTPIDWALD